MDTNSSSEQGSDREVDSFEDAQDMTHRPQSQAGRSLTDRGRSTSSTVRNTSSHRPTESPVPAANADAVSAEAATTETEKPESLRQGLSEQTISVASMDDVNLDEDHGRSQSPHPSRESVPAVPPRLPPKESGLMQRQSATLPPRSISPSQISPEKKDSMPAPPPPPPRKLTSPFTWLSRATNSEKNTKSPPLPSTAFSQDRRNTNASITTVGSNPELTLSKIEDEGTSNSPTLGGGKPTLRDRFKLLRMREEAGLTDEELGQTSSTMGGGALAGLVGRTSSISLGIASPISISEGQEDATSAPRLASSPGPTSVPKTPPVNPNLAPGTAAGISAGPVHESAAPVDWDLWQAVVYEGPAAVARTSPEELNHAIASGIPQAIRGVVWQVLAQSKNEELEAVYKELVVRGTDKEKVAAPAQLPRNDSGHLNGTGKEKESTTSSASSIHSDYSTPATTSSHGQASSPTADTHGPEAIAKLHAEKKKKAQEEAVRIQKLEKQIKRDLGARTSYSKYLMAAGLQDGLFGVCKAYALFDDAVGYAQGMNFIAMPLLFNMPEEEAFCMLVKLMNKYGLRDMFVQDMPGLHLHLYQFERLLEDFEPALYCHLHRRGVNPQLYATQWFLTLFAYRFPLQLVLRIYDLILSEGLEGAILKFGIVLMQKNAQTLLGMKDMSHLSTFLKERLFDVYIDKAPSANSLLESGFFGSASGIDKEVYRADMLVQDACAVKITPEMLTQYTAEWKEKQRVEHERVAELESLNQANHSLQQRLRALEERIEKSDIEHVQVASELVRTKVENETLLDENESLKGQVEELKRIVESQPAEVEERLKSEMDRMMKRNIEVHNENRSLEEQLQEMEKDLVETKLQYAQINSEHEMLKQKWNNLSSMFQSGQH